MSTDLHDRFNQLIEEQQALRAKFQETGQSLFMEVFKEFFKTNTEVNAVLWTQYTPYFNDGEECLFSVHEPNFTNAKGEDLEEVHWGEYDGENEEVWVTDEWSLRSDSDWNKHTKEKVLSKGGVDIDSCVKLSNMLQSSEMEDILRELFDDHVRIIATREGFEVLDYDHD